MKFMVILFNYIDIALFSFVSYLMLDSDVLVDARLVKSLFTDRTRSIQRTLFIGRNERFFVLQTDMTR